MMIGYDIDDRFTMEHFPLCERRILTTSFFFTRDSMYCICLKLPHCQCQILDFFLECTNGVIHFQLPVHKI
jgi:hypothetical protein